MDLNSLLKDINNYKRKPSKTDIFIIEGLRGVEQSISNGVIPSYIIFSESFLIYEKDSFKRILNICSYSIIPDNKFSKLSFTKNPAGIMAIFKKNEYKISDIIGLSPLFLLDEIQDPGNMGTIFRTAIATGIKGIILNKGCVSPYNPKVVRSSLGGISTLPFIKIDYMADFIDDISNDYTIFASDGKSSNNIWDCDLSCEKISFLIGNEARGISKENLGRCSKSFKIPLLKEMESLNAGVSASIIAYEYIRQSNIKRL